MPEERHEDDGLQRMRRLKMRHLLRLERLHAEIEYRLLACEAVIRTNGEVEAMLARITSEASQ